MLSFKKILILVILSLFLFSCADSEDAVRSEAKKWTIQKLYNEANTTLNNGNWSKAIKLYKVLESTYPYGIYAQQGLLDLAYAYYQHNEAEFALPTLDQFIKTYPTNPNMDYALYLKGYINYKNDNGLLSRFTGQDLSERDPKSLQEAYFSFYELVTRFPDSKFTPDAKDKINRLVNAMARGEIYRARFYMRIKAYLAAIGRAQNIITNYPKTQYIEEALALQVVAYKNLNQKDLSESTQNVLALNFPNSKYIKQYWEYQDIAWYAFWH